MATSSVSSLPNEVFPGVLSAFCWTPQSSLKKAEPESASETVAALTSFQAAAAREEMLLQHMPVVRFVARKIYERLPQHLELDDLISAGVVGLMDAFSKFDNSKNVQFRTYAQFRIRGAILDSLRSLDWGSRELRRKGRSLAEAVQTVTHRLNRRPLESEIAVELGIALDEYQQLLGELKGLEVRSLHETRTEDSAEEELAYLPTAPEEDPLYRCMKSEMSSHLTAAIATLPEREARVLALYYVEEMTLKEIGAILGLVESRVSQIRASALTAVRARLEVRGNHPKLRTIAGLKTRPKAASKGKRVIPAAVIRESAALAYPAVRSRMPVR